MSLPNPGQSFSPFAILTAEEMNDLVENIEALAAGTGLDDGAVGTTQLAPGAATPDRRSGGFAVGTLTSDAASVVINTLDFEPKMVRFFLKPSDSLTALTAEGVSLGTTDHHATATGSNPSGNVGSTKSSGTYSLYMTNGGGSILVQGKVTATSSTGFTVAFDTTRAETWVYEAYA